MSKIWKDKSVLSLRKKFAVQTLAITLVLSSIWLGGLLFLKASQTENYDLDALLDTLNLPEMAPYLASSSVFAGSASGDKFGFSVANAGDFNGDGKDDVIVGAPYACSSPNDKKGKAYIFLGGNAGDGSATTADVVLVGEANHANFGHSVAGGGDFDSDNKDDVVVGAPDYTEPNNNRGRVYIFKGTSSLGPPWPKTISASSADYNFTGNGTYDYFGWSVAIDGNFDDLNGDDVIVGAPGYDSSHVINVDQGRVYMILSPTVGDPTIDATFTGESSEDSWFGKSISYVGDVGNGAKDDMIVGAPEYNNSKGKAYIFYGEASPSGDTSASHQGVTKITGESSGDEFGLSVSHAGDVNGDTNDDVIVGAPGYDDGTKSNAGRAYIFLGTITHGSDLTASGDADKKMTGEEAGAKLGISVSIAGDYNKDTYDDVIVGAYEEDSLTATGTDVGKAHIFYGGSSMDEKVDISMAGNNSSTNRYKLGYAVSNAGDFDNDGYDDVIVGAPEAGSAKGYAHLFNFHDHFTTTGDVSSFWGEQRGYSVAAGKINCDSHYDVIVGAPRYSSPGGSSLDTGKVYVFTGSTTGLSSTPWLTLTESEEDSLFGWSVASGNFDGDTCDDIIVGAPGYSDNKGRAYIYYGSITPNSGVDVTLTGDNSGDNFGFSVAAAETHGNPMISYYDAIVGAPEYHDGSKEDVGRAYVFFGGPLMSDKTASQADTTMTGEEEDDEFGYSVSNAGNWNGDSANSDEVIVGAPYAQGPLNDNNGIAYIYAGSLFGVWGPPIAKLYGERDGDHLGYSVSGAGNFNGDSYDDVVVGAPGYDVDPYSELMNGRAYIFYGGSPPYDITKDVTFTGENQDDQFGTSVSGAGDVDNDGYDDVVVGAPNNDAGGSDAGRVYILYGYSTGDGREDVYMTGSVGEELGFSVANAGDVNGDNYDDVVTGAQGWSSERGRAKVWGDPS